MQHITPVDRVFVKRTRRGSVKTHVRQTYLRDDLPTGSPHLDAPELEPKLQGDRYLVLDTNVVLHQIDLLERPALRDVIVLQTVLDEVRHNKISVHKRLRVLIEDESRRFHVFCNECHREAFAARSAGESPNDRNDRAIRAAAKWYDAQLGGAARVLLLTNDAENLRRAEADGLKASTIHAYVASLPDGAELAELLAAAPGADGADAAPDAKRGARSAPYAAHLPMSELTRGVQAGELHQGKLRVARHNCTRGAVPVHSLKDGRGNAVSEILLRGRAAMNRALDGDTVVVRLLPRSEWARTDGGLAERGKADGADASDDIGVADPAGAHVASGDFGTAVDDEWGGGGGDARPCGEVVGVVKRGWRPYTCVIDMDSAIGNQYLAEPLDARIPRVNITTRQPAALASKLVLVAIDFWEAAHRYPTGHYVRTLGDVGDVNAESEAILHEHEVNAAPFSPLVQAKRSETLAATHAACSAHPVPTRSVVQLGPSGPQACLPEKGWAIPDDEIARRLDLRNGRALVCSVDPPGCVDIDDALHAREIAPGRYEVRAPRGMPSRGGCHVRPQTRVTAARAQVGVHIADVGHFIKAGTAIDIEAASRGTTVYLVNRRIDMVPKRLGEDLCSLHQQVDRLAFSAIWEMDAEANVLSTRFVKTLIRSEAALSYDEAQLRLDDARLTDPLTTSLRTLNSLAKCLKARRNAAGALTLGSPEVRFVLDSETSDPTDVGM